MTLRVSAGVVCVTEVAFMTACLVVDVLVVVTLYSVRRPCWKFCCGASQVTVKEFKVFREMLGVPSNDSWGPEIRKNGVGR